MKTEIEMMHSKVHEVHKQMMLLAYINGIDIGKTVEECLQEIERYANGILEIGKLARDYEGVLFLKIFAEKIHVSPTMFFMENTEKIQGIVEELIKEADKKIDMNELEFDNTDNSIRIKFSVLKRNIYCTEEDFFKYCSEYTDKKSPVFDNMYSKYDVILEKNNTLYCIFMSGDFCEVDGYESIFGVQVSIYTEEKGNLADFVEKCIEKYYKEHACEKNDLCLTDKEHEPMQVHEKEIPTVSIRDRRGAELVVPIFEITKTVDILDTFEGFGKNQKPYERLVISNGFVIKSGTYVHFVIERSHRKDFIGDLTFTEFKTGFRSDLMKHTENELKNINVKKYIDKSEFIRFSKPYRLRAQNSRNRTGYGWEWDWSGGYGDYIEGTLYGETTDYIFAGVYISSSQFYEQSKREEELHNHEVVVEVEQEVFVSGYLKGKYRLVSYEGKLKKTNNTKKEQIYIKVIKACREKYIPIACDKNEKKLYINQKTFECYRAQINRQCPVIVYKNFAMNNV